LAGLLSSAGDRHSGERCGHLHHFQGNFPPARASPSGRAGKGPPSWWIAEFQIVAEGDQGAATSAQPRPFHSPRW